MLAKLPSITVVGLILLLGTQGYAQAPNRAGPSATGAASPSTEWPELVKPAEDAPSILLIMTDDVGFGSSGTFGGPVPTPTFDALAREGLRYTDFTTTGICSPTRAALLTGRNHNMVNVGNVVDSATSGEGFTSDIPKSAATGARLLRNAGYATAMFGKSHLTPSWETGPTGPFDRWPTGLGFGHFYGFLGGDTNQWAPNIYSDTTPVDPPVDQPDYILDNDLANKAIEWINLSAAADPDKPMFIYYATGTAHAPHHAPPEWIARFKGRFDQGWDAVREETIARQKQLGIVPPDAELAPRPEQIPAWSSLTAQQKRVYAREMEAFAGALAYADHEIGRVIEEMRQATNGNLLVVYIQGDNGASAEGGPNGTTNEHATFHGFLDSVDTIDARLDELGGPTALNHFAAGWALALDAPFPWFKQIPSHLGAIRNGMVISWPSKIKDVGGIRTQFHHITDVMPTLLEAAHVTPPHEVAGVEQQPLDGVSMSYTFDGKATPSRRTTQYYAIWDNLGIYHDGWFAGTAPNAMPWKWTTPEARTAHLEGRKWQLYNLNVDFSQTRDLADKFPNKLEEMKALFTREASRNNALPPRRYELTAGRPDYNKGRNRFTYHGRPDRIPEDVAPKVFGRSFTATADVDVSGSARDGTLMAFGGRFGGMSWFIKDGIVTFVYNLMEQQVTMVAAQSALPDGAHRLALQFDRQPGRAAPAKVTVYVDGNPVAKGDVPRTVDKRFTLDETFDVGSDQGTPVAPTQYRTPYDFEGVLDQLVLELR